MLTKVCVYAISKNEEQFVDRFMDGVSEADLVIVGDTGSTDATAQKLRDRGAQVVDIRVDPWRFDEARNKVMDLIPEEYGCLFSIDLDEIPSPGWYEKVVAAWETGATRLWYDYQWGPASRFRYDKIHSRDYKWVSPCHEVLEPGVPGGTPVVDFEVVHKPDASKSRGSYLGLLELAVSERPEDDRVRHYYGRELYYKGQHREAMTQFLRHIATDNAWAAERAASCRMLAECVEKLDDGDPRRFYQKGCDVAPDQREPYMYFAKYLSKIGEEEEATRLRDRAHQITDRQHHYLEQEWCWDVKSVDTLITEAVAAWGVKDYVASGIAYRAARALDPTHDLVKVNAVWYPGPKMVELTYAEAKISVLVVSHGRTDLAERVKATAMDTASDPDRVEVLVKTCEADEAASDYARIFGPESVGAHFETSKKWNAMAKQSSGDILVMVCDDVIFESAGWDDVLRRAWPDDGIAVMYSGSSKKEFKGCYFLEFPIISRVMVDALGYAAYPGFKHSGLDSWWQIIGEKLNRLFYLGRKWELVHAHEEDGGVRCRSKRYAQDVENWNTGRNPEVSAAHVEVLRKLIM